VRPGPVEPVIDLQHQIEVDAEEHIARLIDLVELPDLLLPSTHQDEIELILLLLALLQKINVDPALHPQEGTRYRCAFDVEWDAHNLLTLYSHRLDHEVESDVLQHFVEVFL
jgi:hypothetical protein